MSPAASEIRSPSSSEPKPSFLANPKINSEITPEFNMDSSGSVFSSFVNAGGFNSGAGFATERAPGRTRPRLMKVRRQIGRARNVQNEVCSGFNPFMQADCVNGLANGVGEGLDRIISSYDEDDDDGDDRARDGSGIAGDFGESGFCVKLGVDHGNESGSKFENLGFVFGAKEKESGGNLYRERRRYSRNAVKPGLRNGLEKKAGSEAEYGKFSFVVGGDGNQARGDLDARGVESSDFGLNLHSDSREKIKLETEAEGGEGGNIDVSVGANNSSLDLNLDGEKGKPVETAKHPDFDNAAFVFGATKSDIKATSTFDESESAGVLSGSSFEFCASSADSASSFKVERRETGNFFVKTDLECPGRTSVEPEPQKVEAGGGSLHSDSGEGWNKDYYDSPSFAFGSSNHNSYHLHKLKNEKNNDSEISTRDHQCCDEDSYHSCRDSNGSYHSFRDSSGSYHSCPGSSGSSVCKLQDDMEKLDIRGYKNVASANISEDPLSQNVGVSSCKPSMFSAGDNPSSNVEQFFQGHREEDTELKPKEAAAWSFSSSGMGSQPNGSVSEVPSMAGADRNVIDHSTSIPEGSGVSFSDFKIPCWDPSSFKENLFPQVNGKLEIGGKSSVMKDKRSKRTKGKLSSLGKHGSKKDHIPRKSGIEENMNSSECYSPMDFSPYQENKADDQFLSEAPVAPCETTHLDKESRSEYSVSAEEENVINKNHEVFEKPQEECFQHDLEKLFGVEFSSKESADRANSGCYSGTSASGFGDETKFTFSAPSSSHGGLSSRKRLVRKKNKAKTGNNSFIITPRPNVDSGFLSIPFPPRANDSFCSAEQIREKDILTTQNEGRKEPEVSKQSQLQTNSYIATIEAACEMWRLRGNHAYRNGDMSQAEDHYTQGINNVPANEASGCYIKPLVLCYSNRAATRISLGRLREALADCLIAANVDPDFIKAYVRAANCHLVLGNIEDAVQYFNKCLGSAATICLDRRTVLDAADGLQKAQKVADLTSRSSILLKEKTSDAASNALEMIAEALSISSCSEKLLEMKAETLCRLRKFEEAIKLCEETLDIAEKNFSELGTNNHTVDTGGSECYSRAKLWRWNLIAKSYFYLGKLDVALDLLKKFENVGSMRSKSGSMIFESSVSLAVTIRELLRLKNAGNEAFRSGKYAEAAEHYTVALSSNIESRPFVAICFCNRAAAYQALGQISDAIADCSVAIALNGNYTKAISRRATLHGMIRDYRQAATDLQRLVSILENQSEDKTRHSGGGSRSSGSNSKELRQARTQLSTVQENARKGIPLDLYLILGVKLSDSATDIKKSYRKAALRHHPDKAGQFLARSENGDDGQLWKEIMEEVHQDADRLFKMIGEAYAVLSDTQKRSEYDLEEELRKEKESRRSSPVYRASDDDYGSPFPSGYDHYGYSFARNRTRRNWPGYWSTTSRY